MSSYQVGGGPLYASAGVFVGFVVDADSFEESSDTLLRTWNCRLQLTDAADYAALASVVCQMVTVRMTFGSGSHVDIGAPGPGVPSPVVTAPPFGLSPRVGGLGQGLLTLDNVDGSPFRAVLTRLSRGPAWPGNQSVCRATFQEIPS